MLGLSALSHTSPAVERVFKPVSDPASRPERARPGDAKPSRTRRLAVGTLNEVSMVALDPLQVQVEQVLLRTERSQRWLRDFGYRVCALREAAGLSQAELAVRADIHVTYLSSVERGRRNLSLINIRALAEGLDVPPSRLFEAEELT